MFLVTLTVLTKYWDFVTAHSNRQCHSRKISFSLHVMWLMVY